MRLVKIYTQNTLRNWNYLLLDEESREAISIDPFSADPILKELETQRGGPFKLKYIVNTHEHGDHISGNRKLVKVTGAKLCAHTLLRETIPGIDRLLNDGDVISFGGEEIQILHTPGHTMGHIVLFIPNFQSAGALISGDTLFNGGVGHCRMGGDPRVLYESIERLKALIPDSTLLFPGHDYLSTNLLFAKSIIVENELIDHFLEREERSPRSLTTSLSDEKKVNLFLMADSEELRQALEKSSGQKFDGPESVFLYLRQLRDKW